VHWQRLTIQLALRTDADPDETSGIHVVSRYRRTAERLEERAALIEAADDDNP
jgi:hypothetical protein